MIELAVKIRLKQNGGKIVTLANVSGYKKTDK
jgi:hypothetical protein